MRLSTPPALVLLAHGTAEDAGAAAVVRLAHRVAGRLAGVPVRVAFAGVRGPDLADVLAEVNHAAVVVPAFLAAGFHVRVDVPAQLELIGRRDVRLAAALGPDPCVVLAAVERLRAAGWAEGQQVVFAAAGSSDPQAVADVRRAARRLGRLIGTGVPVGYIAAGEPRVGDIVRAEARRGPVAVASWLLAPGVFHRSLTDLGADVVAAPLADHPAVADTVIARYLSALSPDGPRIRCRTTRVRPAAAEHLAAASAAASDSAWDRT